MPRTPLHPAPHPDLAAKFGACQAAWRPQAHAFPVFQVQGSERRGGGGGRNSSKREETSSACKWGQRQQLCWADIEERILSRGAAWRWGGKAESVLCPLPPPPDPQPRRGGNSGTAHTEFTPHHCVTALHCCRPCCPPRRAQFSPKRCRRRHQIPAPPSPQISTPTLSPTESARRNPKGNRDSRPGAARSSSARF